MSFGILGSTSSGAADNAEKLLEISKALTTAPEETLAQFHAVAGTIREERAAVATERKEAAAEKEEAKQMMAAARAEQAALDTHKEQLRKLIG